MKAMIRGVSGENVEITLNQNMYKAAHDAGMTVPTYLSTQFKTDEDKYGSVFNQAMASAGLFAKDDPKNGIKAATVQAVMDGSCDMMFQTAAGGTNTADAIPASRILFPAAILQLVENKLYGDRNSEIAMFDTFVANKQSIAGTRYEYPVIDMTRPEKARSSRTSQLAEPNLMMTLTTSDKQGYVPSFALGLQISDQAMKSSTIDFVSLSVARQAEIEAAERLDACIQAMVSGDADDGFAALTPVKVSVFDTSITTNGTITHKAWLKWLANKRRIRSIDICLMTLDTFLKVEGRPGQPKKIDDATDKPFAERPNLVPSLLNLSIGAVKVFIVEPGVIADDVIVGFDSRYAMRKVTNSEAEYRAAEQLVMLKGEQMRWDWGYTIHRLYDDAWDMLSLEA